MPERLRKFIGMIALVTLVVVYAGIAITIPIQGIPGYLQAIYYVVVGLAWVIPAAGIIAWMQWPRSPKA